MEEMAGLDPGFAAFRPGRGAKRASGRKPKPGVRVQPVFVVLEIAFERQDLGAAGRVERDPRVRLPAFESNVLAVIAIEGDQLHARPTGSRRERLSRGVKPDLRAVLRIELPELDKNDAPGRRPRSMPRPQRVADIRSGPEIAVLVLENSVEDQELFAAAGCS
jgi:hypothetical protein